MGIGEIPQHPDLDRELTEIDAPFDYVTFLETILDNVSDCIIAVNKQGLVTYVNRPYARILGLEQEHCIGRHITEVVSKETQLHLVAQGSDPVLGEQLTVRGQKFLVNQMPIRVDGVTVGAVGVALFQNINRVRDLAHKLFSLDLVQKQERSQWRARYCLTDIIGSSSFIMEAKERAVRAARTRTNVLITGETGTGKELFAQAIHNASERAKYPFVRMNCSAIPRELLEAELFGYAAGAFTGAHRNGNPGKFELASRGTIFLDEIGDMPLSMQTVLLRVLQEHEIVRLGDTHPTPVDVRIICATHQDLESKVRNMTFRQDLFYRLNVFQIRVAPLRERLQDLPAIVERLLLDLCEELGFGKIVVPPSVMQQLQQYSWPGNIRELRNVLEQALHFLEGEYLPPIKLSNSISKMNSEQSTNKDTQPVSTLAEAVAAAEHAVLGIALEQTGGNKTRAASLLKVDRSYLYKKLREHGFIL